MARTDSDLAAASAHLHYEYWMLEQTAGVLSRRTQAMDQVAQNAYLESFLVHVRLLMQFIGWERPVANDGKPKKPHPLDVLAEEFAEGWQIPPLPQALAGSVDKISKRVVHLSHQRVAVHAADRPWAYLAIAVPILDGVEKVIAAAPSSRLAPVWRDLRQNPVKGPRFLGIDPSSAGATGPAGPTR